GGGGGSGIGAGAQALWQGPKPPQALVRHAWAGAVRVRRLAQPAKQETAITAATAKVIAFIIGVLLTGFCYFLQASNREFTGFATHWQLKNAWLCIFLGTFSRCC